MPTGWQKEYRQKLVTPDQAVRAVKSGDLVVVPVGTDPQTLLVALLRRAHERPDH